jgi:hypothetical protein
VDVVKTVIYNMPGGLRDFFMDMLKRLDEFADHMEISSA